MIATSPHRWLAVVVGRGGCWMHPHEMTRTNNRCVTSEHAHSPSHTTDGAQPLGLNPPTISLLLTLSSPVIRVLLTDQGESEVGLGEERRGVELGSQVGDQTLQVGEAECCKQSHSQARSCWCVVRITAAISICPHCIGAKDNPPSGHVASSHMPDHHHSSAHTGIMLSSPQSACRLSLSHKLQLALAVHCLTGRH